MDVCVLENQKSKVGGLAYEVILKPAAGDVPRPSSPPKEKGITHDDIARKLQEAEERRQVGHVPSLLSFSGLDLNIFVT